MTAAVPPAARRADNIGGGILLVLGFATLIPFVEAAAKGLGALGVIAVQIAWVRFTMQIVIVGGVIWALNGGRVGRAPQPLWAFVARGLCIMAGSTFLYAGLAFLPMADSSAIFFIEPLLLTALSAALLREPIGWRRWSAVAIGFVGAVMIAGPNFERVGWAAALPALAALSFTGAVLLTRRFAAQGTALTFQFITALVAGGTLTAVMSVGAGLGLAAFTPSWPDRSAILLLLVVAILSTCTNLMLTQAFRIAPSSALAPFLYLEIVGAVIFGYLIFGDRPALTAVFGALMVVGAGLFVWFRERALRRDVAPAIKPAK